MVATKGNTEVSARDEILGRIRLAALHKARHPGEHPPPALPGGWETFAGRLESVGGAPHGPVAGAELRRMAFDLASTRAGDGRIVAEPTAADWIGPGPWQLASDAAIPHAYEDVAVGFVRGRVACAENGAVAVAGSDATSRALLVLCQHLVLIVSVDSVVPDLHAGFAALPADAFGHHHLTWISGPSKTADIEQALVYGAHGPLTLDVIGVER